MHRCVRSARQIHIVSINASCTCLILLLLQAYAYGAHSRQGKASTLETHPQAKALIVEIAHHYSIHVDWRDYLQQVGKQSSQSIAPLKLPLLHY
jgi:hypothetical protein